VSDPGLGVKSKGSEYFELSKRFASALPAINHTDVLIPEMKRGKSDVEPEDRPIPPPP
jgi:hypothetical protein